MLKTKKITRAMANQATQPKKAVAQVSQPGITQNLMNQSREMREEMDLTQEITKTINSMNPNAPHNIVNFSFKEHGYKATPNLSQTHFHVCKDGKKIFVDQIDQEAQQPAEQSEKLLANQFNFSARGTQTTYIQPRSMSMETQQFLQEEIRGQVSKSVIYDLYKRKNAETKTQVTQSAAQIKENNPNTAFDPLHFVSNEGLLAQQEQLSIQKTEDNQTSALASLALPELCVIQKALNLGERLLTESLYFDVITDFKTWDDPADQYKPSEGSLLPLWKFSPPAIVKNKPVAAIQWHPRFKDIFAVAFGRRETHSTVGQGSGVCIFTLKNVFFPEKIIQTRCDAISIDWCPSNDNLILLGLVDGNVQIWNCSGVSPVMLAQSDSTTGKHVELVSQVKWRVDNKPKPKDGEYQVDLQNFVSVGVDGQLINWSFSQNEIRLVNFSQMYDNGQSADVGPLVQIPKNVKSTAERQKAQVNAVLDKKDKTNLTDDPTVLIVHQLQDQREAAAAVERQPHVVGLTTIQFNPDRERDWMYAVGTDAGLVRLCSTAYNTNYVQSFVEQNNGHKMAVYNMSWNTYQPDILATCSEDYTVKLFQIEYQRPVFTYDLQAPVTCVEFSKSVSTVLLASTAQNNLHIFDFAVKRENELCIQQVVPDGSKLTKFSLNQHYPIVIVGDNQGVIRVFKLSPNLRNRSVFKPEKKGGVIPVLAPEEINRNETEMENRKIREFINWCRQATAASGIE